MYSISVQLYVQNVSLTTLKWDSVLYSTLLEKSFINTKKDVCI